MAQNKWEEVHRISYHDWSSGQLSVAKHYGYITINWKFYEFDHETLMQMKEDDKKWIDPDKKYKPDLVHYKRKWKK